MSELELSESFLDEIRCSKCNGFLHPPICLFPDGNSVCGSCSNSRKEVLQRQLTFENFLKKFKYPCKFKQNGCKSVLTFEQIKEHEDECIYISHPCPAPSFCKWEGPVETISSHFVVSHSDLVSDKLECKIALAETDKKGLGMIINRDISAIVKYQYSNASNEIQYHIQHFNTVDIEMTVRVSLVDDLQPDCNINIKGDNPVLFNKSFYLDFTMKTLNLDNYLPAMNNTNCILLKIDVDGKANGDTIPKQLSHDLLVEKLRCKMCKGFLLPPLYCNGQKSAPACWFCSQQFNDPIPFENKLLLTVSMTRFPCRWRGCEIRKPGRDLPDHELSCLLRQIKCHECNEYIIQKNFLSHIKSHGYKSCHEDHFSYVINFSDDKDGSTKICTVKGNNKIYLTCKTRGWSAYHFIHIASDFYNYQVNVEFEHEHCKIKPKALVLESEIVAPNSEGLDKKWLLNSTKINRSDLPPCFHDDKPVNITIRF